MLGAGDCERLRDGLVAQPLNTASSLAYVLVGAWLLARAARMEEPARPLGVAAGLTALVAGVGSADYHGPGSVAQPWLHDLGVVAPLLGVAAVDLARLGGPARRRLMLAGLAGAAGAAGLLLRAVPGAAVPLAAGAAAVAAGLELAVWRREGAGGGVLAAAGAVGVAALLNALGRTGGPLCDPDGLVQPHAVWHVLTAAALGAWAAQRLPMIATRPMRS